MKIPFGTLLITSRSREIIKEILSSGRLSGGKYVREFEERFAKLVGVREAVAVSSGTAALALALAVLYDNGASRGDEVIMPALTFTGTANAVFEAGFIPRFVDVKKEDLIIDCSKIERAITRKTIAIMPVHLMGKPADMDKIKIIAKKHGLRVICDAAEAHGAFYRGKNVGALGDMTGFSLYVAHIISTVEGGIITTNNKKYAEILRSLRSHGRACSCSKCVINTASAYCPGRFKGKDAMDMRFMFDRLGFSAKMNELEAAIGLGNLDSYEEILEKRKGNLRYLINNFGRFNPYFYTIEERRGESLGPHAFPFIAGAESGIDRNEVANFLAKKGIDNRTLFMSLPTQCGAFKFLKYKTGEFPNAEYVGIHGLHIGVHQDMGMRECDFFLDSIDEFISRLKRTPRYGRQ